MLEGFLHFYADPNLVTEGCLPAKGIVKGFPHRPFSILVTNTAKKKQHHHKHKLLGRLKANISTIVSSEAPRKSSQDELLFPSLSETIKSEGESSLSTS